MLRHTTIATLLLWLSASSNSQAANDSPFELNLAVDVAVVASAFTLMIVPPFVSAELGPPHCNPCDPGNLNALDRAVVGNDSATSKTISDIELFSLPAVATGLYLLDLRFGWNAFWQDVMMVAEVVLVSGALQQLLSIAVRRPRPFMYTAADREDIRLDPESARSFYSGHAATAFALATSFSYIYTTRRPQMRHKWLVWLASLLVAAPMPFLRVAAGEHFWTDVLVGSVLGAGIGITIPILHRRKSPDGLRVGLVAGGGTFGLAGTF